MINYGTAAVLTGAAEYDRWHCLLNSTIKINGTTPQSWPNVLLTDVKQPHNVKFPIGNNQDATVAPRHLLLYCSLKATVKKP